MNAKLTVTGERLDGGGFDCEVSLVHGGLVWRVVGRGGNETEALAEALRMVASSLREGPRSHEKQREYL